MKALPIVLAALMVATTATAQSRPNYSPEYQEEIRANLELNRSYCARLTEAGRETYDDKRLLAQLRVIEAWGDAVDAGKISLGMIEKARAMGLVTQTDVDCSARMMALIQYALQHSD